jgi:hypothetical protein
MERGKHFKIVEKRQNKQLTLSGICALCGNEYQFGNRVLAEYSDGKGVITEPFNLCDRCYQVQSDKQRTTQTKLERW